MDYTTVESTREFVARMDHGVDWREQIETFADENEIDAGFFYGQDDQEYRPVEFDEPLEVAACVGNVSRLDDGRFAHTHATLSRADGSTVAGHLNRATTFAGELYVRAFDAELVRERDETTDLDLWEL